MRLLLLTCGAFFALVSANGVAAKSTRLQTIDLTDMQMSTEGGEARLYRIDNGQRRFCRIEAIHFGETGKAVYVFDFGARLSAAERREYRYDLPISMDSNVKPTLTDKTTLASRQGQETLSKDFETYKAFFDARQLAKCSDI